MIDSELRRSGELNLASHAAWLHAHVAGARVLRFGDFQVADSGLQHDTHNVIARVGVERGFDPSDVAAVREHVAASGRPFSWWVADEASLPIAAPALTAAGFVEAEAEDAMALAVRDASLPPADDAPIVRVVDSAPALRAYGAILAANWDPPAEDVQRFLAAADGALGDGSAGERGSTFFLAHVDGRPVAGAEVHVASGVAGIYGVATLAAHRGRGLATHLMAAALRDIEARGISWAVLQATERGSSIYRRLGFRSLGRCVEFASPRRSGPA